MKIEISAAELIELCGGGIAAIITQISGKVATTDQIAALAQEITQMSATIEQQVQQATANLLVAFNAIAAEFAAAIPPVGSTVTQADADALNAVVAKFQALATQFATPAPAGP